MTADPAFASVPEAGPVRPLLRWHGGKWLLAPWIIGHFPPHRIYVEPFGGAASVLLQKPRCHGEVYNDLDDEVVTLMRVLRATALAGELHRRLKLTPFARTEFIDAYQPGDDAVEVARRLIVRSFMGHGSDGATSPYRTGFRANSNRSGTVPARDWVTYADALPATIARLRGVIIEHRDAALVMSSHDGPDTLHYVDPPYLPETRTRTWRRPGVGNYRHDMTREQHVALLSVLIELKGMVAVSGYPSDLYDETLGGWTRVEKPALADGAAPRTEVLWLNRALVERLGHGPLFGTSP